MRYTENRGWLLSTSFIAFLAVATPVAAQDDDTSAQANESGVNDQFEDGTIIVTATRREADVQDIPIAVTAVSQEALERQAVFEVTDLSVVAPSFVADAGQSPSTSTTYRIRGIGTNGNNFGFESSVGVFLDGVYLSRPGVALGELTDIQQVEVLRGPQGTLFGRNTSAGAVHVRTRNPDLDEFEGFASATAGNFDLVRLEGGLNVPLVEDTLGLRVTGAYRNRDGTIESTNGNESQAIDQFIVRGKLQWEPSSMFLVRLAGDYSEASNECCASIVLIESPLRDAGAFAAVGLPASGGVDQPNFGQAGLDDRIGTFDQPEAELDQWGVSLEAEWDLGFADLTYLGAYREFTSDEFVDPDFVGIDAITAETDASIDSLTQELRLQGEAFEGRLDWLVGAFYSNEDITFNLQLALGPDYGELVGAVLFPVIGTSLGPTPLEVFSGGIPTDGATADNFFTQDSESFSIFTHNTFSVTDRFDVTLGLRYVDETKDGNFTQLSASNPACLGALANAGGFTGTPLEGLVPTAIALNCFAFVAPADLPGSGVAGLLPTPATFDGTFEDDELVWTAKLGYEFDPDVLGYASYTHGYKAGGFNLDATAAVFGADPTFESETVDAFEVGLKSKFFDNRVTANIAIFHQILSDFQVLDFNGIQFSTFNVDEALSTGVEIETVARITEGLTANAAYVYTDARFPSDCADPGAAPAVFAVCGTQLRNAPKHVGLLGFTYENLFPGSDWEYFFNAQGRYESERVTDSEGLIFQGENVRINLRAGVGPSNGVFRIEAWVNNLTDQNTISQSFATTLRTGSFSAQLQPPRTYGLTVRTRF
ncbi:MAG: TonB-dependent receptor [Pseudomonadota bacterium]